MFDVLCKQYPNFEEVAYQNLGNTSKITRGDEFLLFYSISNNDEKSYLFKE